MKSVGVFWSKHSAQSSVNCCQSNCSKMQSYNKQDEHLPSNQMKFILLRESNICVWATLERQHKITLLKKGSSSGQAHIPGPHVRTLMINSVLSLVAGWEEHSNFMSTKDTRAPLMTAEQETIQKTQRSQGLLKMQRGGASQHAWVIIKINQRPSEERLIGSDYVSKCAKETTDAKEKQAVDSKLLLHDRKRWVVTMTHTLTHTVTHTITHIHQGASG